MRAGAADGTVKVWDRRRLSEALHTFKLHDSPINRVEWAPYKPGNGRVNLCGPIHSGMPHLVPLHLAHLVDAEAWSVQVRAPEVTASDARSACHGFEIRK